MCCASTKRFSAKHISNLLLKSKHRTYFRRLVEILLHEILLHSNTPPASPTLAGTHLPASKEPTVLVLQSASNSPHRVSVYNCDSICRRKVDCIGFASDRKVCANLIEVMGLEGRFFFRFCSHVCLCEVSCCTLFLFSGGIDISPTCMLVGAVWPLGFLTCSTGLLRSSSCCKVQRSA